MGEQQEYPALFRLGEYAFFAWLTFWSTLPIAIFCKWIGAPDFVRSLAGYVGAIFVFMTLRDMTKRPRNHLISQGAEHDR